MFACPNRFGFTLDGSVLEPHVAPFAGSAEAERVKPTPNGFGWVPLHRPFERPDGSDPMDVDL